jgi:hypothetical protein
MWRSDLFISLIFESDRYIPVLKTNMSTREGPVNHWSEALNVNYAKSFEKNKNLSRDEFLLNANSFDSRLDGINFDVTNANYYHDVMTNPNQKNFDHYRTTKNFTLDKNEMQVFQKNGMVVSERNGSKSFADAYLMLYNTHLPVFISLDSILHAWHESFDAMLEEIESTKLYYHMLNIMEGMIHKLEKIYSSTFTTLSNDLQMAIKDVDFFLHVGKELLINSFGDADDNVDEYTYYGMRGKQVDLKPITYSPKSVFGNNERIVQILNAVKMEQLLKIDLFGEMRDEDFSQFKPRGHYEKSAMLKKYFRGMTWLGRTIFRISKNASELGASLLLLYLLDESGMVKIWTDFDKLLQIYVGKTDSMNFITMRQLVEIAKINLDQMFNPTNATYSLQVMKQVQVELKNTELGKQLINSSIIEIGPFQNRPEELERAFTFMGQRFTIDGWMTEKVVFHGENPTQPSRRTMSALDINYAVFNNTNGTRLISDRMTRTQNKVEFRDGVPFQAQLESSREAINQTLAEHKDAPQESVYMMWLDVLRKISESEQELLQNKFIPQVFKTKSWAMKDIETQLASWAQLHHDTILYVKQPYFSVCGCDYPAGYVDPRASAWEAIARMVTVMADAIDAMEGQQSTPLEMNMKMPEKKSNSDRREKITHFFINKEKGRYKPDQGTFLRTFAFVANTLAGLARKQLVGEKYSDDDMWFVKNTVHDWGYMSGMPWGATGWYNHLYYKGTDNSKEWNPTVADVYTCPPDPMYNDTKGSVLFEGVGNVNTMYLAMDFANGEKCVFVSPVLSHYEFYGEGMKRMGDAEWRNMINEHKTPQQPEWTSSYLVPGRNTDSATYRHKDH